MKIINQEQDFLHIRESYQHLGEYSLAGVQFHQSQKDEMYRIITLVLYGCETFSPIK